jgi:hypothetical protein
MMRKLKPRLAAWRGATGVGVLLACVLGPLSACAQENVLTSCSGSAKTIVSQPVMLCLGGQNNKSVWVKAESGRGFQAMAHACCGDSKLVVDNWTGLYGSPSAGLWYPVEFDHLKDMLKARVSSVIQAQDREQGKRIGTQGVSGAVTETPQTASDTSAKVAEKKDRQDEARPSKEKVEGSGSGAQDPNLQPLVIGWVVEGILFLSLYGAAVLIVLRLRRIERRLPSSETFTEGPNLETSIATLASALRQALQEKITVELSPPTNPDWNVLLMKLGQALGERVHPSPAGERSGEDGGRRPVPFGPTSSAAKVESRGISRERLYVNREMNYGAAAKNFGGELAFQETPSNWSSFYVEVDSSGSGWLYVNPSAREYDALYDRLFSLGQNQFPFTGNVAPKQVRRDGQRWVLESAAW